MDADPAAVAPADTIRRIRRALEHALQHMTRYTEEDLQMKDALAALDELLAVGERDRQQIAQLTEALAAYELAVQAALRAAPLHWHEYRDPFELRPEIGKARRLGRAAVLAGEEDTANG